VTLITRRFDLLNNLLLAGGALLLMVYAIARPDDVRAFFASRYARYGSSTLLSIVFFSAIGLLLYWVAYQNDDWRLDMTASRSFHGSAGDGQPADASWTSRSMSSASTASASAASASRRASCSTTSPPPAPI
jgi:hypothetical protein